MKDNALLIVVGIIIVGGIGWLVPHIVASYPMQSAAQSPAAVAQPPVEVVKKGPAVTPKRESKPVQSRSSETSAVKVPVVESEVDRNLFVKTPAPATAPPPRFPTIDQIKVGTDKPQVKEMFGDPALSAMTTNHGHDIETFAYARDRGQAVTVICFEDGRVTAPPPQRPPFSPTDLRATVISPTQVSLTWTNNAEDATAVLVQMEENGSSARFELGRAQTLTNTTVFNLPANRSYSFRVRAQNAVGYSEYSRSATVTLALSPSLTEK